MDGYLKTSRLAGLAYLIRALGGVLIAISVVAIVSLAISTPNHQTSTKNICADVEAGRIVALRVVPDPSFALRWQRDLVDNQYQWSQIQAVDIIAIYDNGDWRWAEYGWQYLDQSATPTDLGPATLGAAGLDSRYDDIAAAAAFEANGGPGAAAMRSIVFEPPYNLAFLGVIL
jgi:hypothetical protein